MAASGRRVDCMLSACVASASSMFSRASSTSLPTRRSLPLYASHAPRTPRPLRPLHPSRSFRPLHSLRPLRAGRPLRQEFHARFKGYVDAPRAPLRRRCPRPARFDLIGPHAGVTALRPNHRAGCWLLGACAAWRRAAAVVAGERAWLRLLYVRSTSVTFVAPLFVLGGRCYFTFNARPRPFR